MDGNDSPNNRIQIPTDDGSVDQALVELDAKLDAWAEAIMQTQRLAEESIESQTPPCEERPEQTIEIEDPVVESVDDQAESPATGGFDLDKVIGSGAPVTRTTHFPDDEDANELLDGLNDEPATTPPPTIPEPPPEASVEVEAEDDTARKEEEEALLAELEPEILKKVQVLRRINKQRDLREMIEQVRSAMTSKPADETKPKKGFFWRKG